MEMDISTTLDSDCGEEVHDYDMDKEDFILFEEVSRVREHHICPLKT